MTLKASTSRQIGTLEPRRLYVTKKAFHMFFVYNHIGLRNFLKDNGSSNRKRLLARRVSRDTVMSKSRL